MSNDTVFTLCGLFESVAVMFVLLGMQLVGLSRARPAISAKSASASIAPSGIAPSGIAPSGLNAAAGMDMIAIGVTLATLAIMFVFASTPPAVFGFACSGWLLLGTTGILLHGTLSMRHW